MKHKGILVILGLVFLLQACYKDNTSTGGNAISDIEVSFGEFDGKETIHIDRNEILEIDPEITQSTREKELTYEWEVNYELYSNEKKFVFTGEALGRFPVRLKVSNEDGSTFKEFILRVNSPYEEGLVVLGQDSDKGVVSFIRRHAGQDFVQTPVEEVEYDVYSLNNEDLALSESVTDIVKSNERVYVSTSEPGRVHLLNHLTFQEEAVVEAPEFPDFKPFRMNIPEGNSRESLVLTTEGKLFNLSTFENLVLRNNAFGSDVDLAPKTQVIGTINFTMNYFWDKAASRLWNLWYVNSNSKDYFQGQEIVQFFATVEKSYVLTKDKGTNTYRRTVFGPYIQEYMADPLAVLEEQEFTVENTALNIDAITLLDESYFQLVYAGGRDIYKWHYSGTVIDSDPYITIDIPGEITALAKNPKNKELYVGVYDATAGGNKGSVLVYDIDNGRKLGAFEGVSGKPLKMIYKIND